nr:MAG TPA: minor tail protein [Bacteriophage sp.]
MDTNIDSLSIQIKTNANSAVKGINALSASLSKLENATKGISGLKEVTNQVKSLGNALDTLGTENAAKISEISKALSKLPANMQKVASSSNGFKKFGLYLGKVGTSLAVTGRVLRKFVNLSNDYIENMNLFNVSMGEYAKEARVYAEQVAEVMGIDPGEWMRSQGVFNTIITGFGVASDKAYLMSKNLTQLGYDLSSFFNIDAAEAMTKLRSGISGELEPLRQLGYDLSVARLQQEAYNLGITKSVSAMTQAEKSQLRYYTIMTQVTKAQGDMARTLESPANQLRVFKAQLIQAGRALGNLFIPLLNEILPVCIAVTKVITMLTKAFANLFGLEMKEVFPDMQEGSNAMGDLTDNTVDENKELAELNKKLKKTKNALLGIDELNVISPPEADSASGSGNSGAGGDVNVPLPEYEFLENAVNQKVNDIVEKLKELLGITGEINSWGDLFKTKLDNIAVAIGGIGLGIAAWKFGNVLKSLGLIKGSTKQIAGMAVSIGSGFIFAYETADALANGVDWGNFLGQLGSGIGLVSGLAMTFGTKGAQIGGIVTGLGMLVTGCIDESKNGLNAVNGIEIGTGATALGASIGSFFGPKGALIGAAVGLGATLIGLLIDNWDTVSAFLSEKWEEFSAWFGDKIESFSTWFKEKMEGIKTWIQDNLITPVSDFFSDLWEDISTWASDCWEDIKAPFIVAADWFDENVITPLSNICSDLWDDFVKGATDAWQGVKDTFNTVSTFFSDTFSEAWQKIVDVFSVAGDIFTDIKDAVVSAFKYIVNELIIGLNKAIAKPFNAINDALMKIKEIEIFDMKPFKNLREINVPVIPMLANGGMVDVGQLFIARESGPEMVGTIGHKTTVANNTQIVSAVSVGVFNAMVRAMQLAKQVSTPKYTVALAMPEGSSYGRNETDFETVLEKFFEKHLSEMAEDIKRQADKEEKTVVTVGARSITQAVDKQRKANGYNFSGGGN